MKFQQDLSELRAKIIVLVVGAAAGAALLGNATRFRPEFETWLRQDVRGRSHLVVALMVTLMSGPLLVYAAYLWIRSRVRFARHLAVVLAAAAFLLAFLFWRALSVLVSHA